MTPAGELDELVEELGLGPDVERGRRLVEHQQARARLERVQRPRDRDPLPLAAGQVGAALVGAGQGGVEAGRQRVDGVGDARALGRTAQHGRLARRVHRADRDVVRGRQLVPDEVLEDHADLAAPRGDVEVGQVRAVHREAARGGLVQAGEQLDQRRLARAVDADDRRAQPRGQLQVQAVEHRAGCCPGRRSGRPRTGWPSVGRLRRDGQPGAGGGEPRLGVGHPRLELRERRDGLHPVLRLHVRLGVVLAERDRRDDRLDAERQRGQRDLAGRRGPGDGHEHGRADHQPDRRVDEVRHQVELTASGRDRVEHRRRRVAVLVGEPARPARRPASPWPPRVPSRPRAGTPTGGGTR